MKKSTEAMHGPQTILMLIVAAMTLTVDGDVITVCESGCDHTSIIAALQNAEDDDVIQLSDQLYREGEGIVLNKEVTVIGAVDEFGKPTSRIDGQGLYRVMRTTDHAVLENLVTVGGHAERHVSHPSFVVRDLAFIQSQDRLSKLTNRCRTPRLHERLDQRLIWLHGYHTPRLRFCRHSGSEP